MSEVSDPTIFKRIRKGDEKAFSELFETFYTSLCFFANKYLEDMDLSRSVVQQVFVDLWVKREKINIQYSPKSYLYHSVKNRSIDHIRKEKRNIPFTEVHGETQKSPFQDLLEEAELNKRINDSINNLPDKCREIFLLCRFDGLKYTQIAKQLNISVKTVEMQMGIALKKIRKKISDSQMINLLIFIHSKKN